MPKYTIELKKLLIQNIEVEANSAAEALRQIVTQYENCDIELTLDDAHEDTHYSVTNQFGDVLITK